MQTDLIEEYIEHLVDEEPLLLKEMTREANVKLLRPRMMSGHLQGRLLKMFVRMCQPKYILEVGTYTGYSALSMAEALPLEGKIYTIDPDDEMENFARKYINRSPDASKINYIVGDALQEVPKLGVVFDMMFIDGDKREYQLYYESFLSYLRKGGFMLFDNTLWSGKVLNPELSCDRQTKSIDEFNHYLAKDPRIEKVIIPLRDGMTIVCKL
ncbi:MAG TPA: methyltransferase [Porphyromonadaceae bacterium]|nr:methyltransferase [Porphyromonadaceae bacterium]